jgi:hypothetical protein
LENAGNCIAIVRKEWYSTTNCYLNNLLENRSVLHIRLLGVNASMQHQSSSEARSSETSVRRSQRTPRIFMTESVNVVREMVAVSCETRMEDRYVRTQSS